MADATTQGELARGLRERFEAASARARELAEGLDGEAMAWHPPTGGWSVGEVLEHLVVSADSYLEELPAVTAKARRGSGGPGTPWKPSLMGGFLAKSLAPGTRPMPAPKVYRPAATPRPNVLGELIDRQNRFVRAMDDATDLDWSRVRTGSPVLGLIRVNLGDVFAVSAVHVERHLGQIERVLAARKRA
jgi:hypothetical protein